MSQSNRRILIDALVENAKSVPEARLQDWLENGFAGFANMPLGELFSMAWCDLVLENGNDKVKEACNAIKLDFSQRMEAARFNHQLNGPDGELYGLKLMSTQARGVTIQPTLVLRHAKTKGMVVTLEDPAELYLVFNTEQSTESVIAKFHTVAEALDALENHDFVVSMIWKGLDTAHLGLVDPIIDGFTAFTESTEKEKDDKDLASAEIADATFESVGVRVYWVASEIVFGENLPD